MRYIYLVFVIFLSGCAFKKVVDTKKNHGEIHTHSLHQQENSIKENIFRKTNNKQRNKQNKKIYSIAISGMGCPICEHTALHHLHKIKELRTINLDSHLEGEEFHDITFTVHKGVNPPLARIVNAIEKEDFIVQWLKGNIKGTFINQDDKRLMVIEGSGEPFVVTQAVGNSQSVEDSVWGRIVKDKLLWIDAIIWHDTHDGVYKIALMNH